MKILITGPKCSGKSTLGSQIAERLGLRFYDTDQILEDIYKREHGRSLSFYDIYREIGEAEFRRYEQQASKVAAELDWSIVSAGGSTLLHPDSRRILRKNSIVVLLTGKSEILWQRLEKIGKSKYLQGTNAKENFFAHTEKVVEIIEPYADIIVDITSADGIAEQIIEKIREHLAAYSNAPNTLGNIIRLTTFGESHGPAIGAVLDGIKPGIEISNEDIQKELNRRRPGQSAVSTSRSESDRLKILSGIFEGKTTGSPIAIVIHNKDQDSSKYDIIRDLFRPGHADFTFWKKYGIRDHRGGGRSSGRETAGRVAGGAVAKKILQDRAINITAYSIEIAGIKAENFDYSVIEKNPVRCPDLNAAEKMQHEILKAKENGDSTGGIVELKISGLEPGIGDPVFGKLDARLAGALCSLGAVKGIEFGDGFAAAKVRGSQFNDQMSEGKFLTNHCGGIIGGISTGQEIIVRLAIKPTPSVSTEQQTSDMNGNTKNIKIEGRHDPCIVPRIIPAIEAMAALTLLDCILIQENLNR